MHTKKIIRNGLPLQKPTLGVIGIMHALGVYTIVKAKEYNKLVFILFMF